MTRQTARHPIDLHMHSSMSDGTLSPRRLVAEAARRGVRAIALTDHDTTAGLAEAREAGARLGVRVLDGIELSAWIGREVHILGYFVDPSHPGLMAVTERQRTGRERRARAICARLGELGMPLDPEPIIAGAEGNVGRPHIAAAMIAAGYARNNQEVFDKWLGNQGPANVPIERLSAVEAIDVIHAAGGVAVLAHPGVDDFSAEVPTLVEAGLDGIEILHPAHGGDAIDRFRALARQHDLIQTGGSDFHRPESPVKIGHFGIDDGTLAAMLARRPRDVGPPPRVP